MSVRVDDPGRRTRAVRLAFNPVVRCPAGTPVFETAEGAGCRCAVEQNTLTALREPSSLERFCLADYQLCTSWQIEKERLAEGRLTPPVDDKRGQMNIDHYREGLAERSLVEQEPIEVTEFFQPE